MSSFQSTFEKLIELLLRRLRDNETRETDLLIRLEKCIHTCEESLQSLRQWVTDNTFPDKDCEIYFFKRIKPVVMARHIYYQKVHRLHIGYFNGCGLLEKEKLTRELQEIDRYFTANNNLYEYYRKDCTHHDHVYFLRNKHDWKTCPGISRMGDVFSTSVDEQLAELMAYELLLKYIDGLLVNPVARLRPASVPSLQCTASNTDIIELGYALYASGFFNHGKASIKDVMTFLEDALQTNLQKHSHTFLQIRERKNSTKFIDELKASLLRYIDQFD